MSPFGVEINQRKLMTSGLVKIAQDEVKLHPVSWKLPHIPPALDPPFSQLGKPRWLCIWSSEPPPWWCHPNRSFRTSSKLVNFLPPATGQNIDTWCSMLWQNLTFVDSWSFSKFHPSLLMTTNYNAISKSCMDSTNLSFRIKNRNAVTQYKW